MVKREIRFFILLMIGLLAAGCGQNSLSADSVQETAGGSEPDTSDIQETDAATVEFTDAVGTVHTLLIDAAASLHTYDTDCFVLTGQQMTYTDTDAYTCQLGIDVSFYQGEIDWDRVCADGYTFVFIRIGYRGYGEAGTLVEDTNYRANLAGALAAGLQVGVYFFSQAVTQEEAEEEAAFVLELLDGTDLSLPVVYDPEYILDEDGNRLTDARTSAVSGEQLTANLQAFCRIIEAAGYETAVYTNLLNESETYDMTVLQQYTIWYADYESIPQTPYMFTFWQYSETGQVSGIEGNVDLNIWLQPAGDALS